GFVEPRCRRLGRRDDLQPPDVKSDTGNVEASRPATGGDPADVYHVRESVECGTEPLQRVARSEVHRTAAVGPHMAERLGHPEQPVELHGEGRPAGDLGRQLLQKAEGALALAI